jgi:hypothetical protein
MKKILSLAAITIVALQTSSAQQHAHLYIGATNTAQNTPLYFQNGADFETASSYIKTLTLTTLLFTNQSTGGITTNSLYSGNITFTVLAATLGRGGPVPDAPALGSTIYAQIVSVDGPPGGAFSFWDTGATNPTITLASGTTGTNTFRLSENDGSPDSDPYGHIHGRRFTVRTNTPGIYTVGFRAFDVSSNGTGGGPIHAPSGILKFYFQTGINIASIKKTGTLAAVTFGTLSNSVANPTYRLEYNDSLGNTNWTEIGSAAGSDTLRTLDDTSATNPQRFYRIKVTTP